MINRKCSLFHAALICTLALFFALSSESHALEGDALIEITGAASQDPASPHIKKARFSVEIANDRASQVQGLSGRQKLADDRGMLFPLDRSQDHAFWMKGMLFPIDIIVIENNMKISEILENLQPCLVCPTYYLKGRPAYVLEINAGLSKKLGISVGDSARIIDPGR